MNPEELKIEEYRSLKNSIDMHMKLIPEIFTIMIVATSALLGVGFKYQLFLIFLLPVFIILTLSVLILAQMNEIMLKGSYIKKRYEENIFGWESTLFALREIRRKKAANGHKLIRPFVKAAEDALAFVLIIDMLLLICFAGFSLFFCLYVNQLIFSEYPGWLIYVFFFLVVFIWEWVVIWAYELNREILEAYTSEEEQKILDILDGGFKNTEESMLQGR